MDLKRAPLVVIGDVLLDVDVEGTSERLCPDAPAPVIDVQARRTRPGGAGLAATLAAWQNIDVVLVAGCGGEAGEAFKDLLGGTAQLVELPFQGETPSKTRVRVAGRSLLRMDSGEGRVPDEDPDPHMLDLLQHARGVLVADYGRGTTNNTSVRRALEALPSNIPLVWDPHVKGSVPVGRSDLVVPNRAEAAWFASRDATATPGSLASMLLDMWGCGSVSVTLGAEGAILAHPSQRERFVARRVDPSPVRDVCGAGDSFAAAAAVACARGADRSDAVAAAVEHASRFVAEGGAASVLMSHQDRRSSSGFSGRCGASEVVEQVRRDGGRLVATGGCFDLLHPGHVRLLERARALGDALVVCLNSDASVQRLKGPNRPLIGERDRKRLLEALEAVDAVVIFEESSPSNLLAELRPDVWVKGGDYDGAALPESETMYRHGGQVIFLPLVDDYSTSRLLSTVRTTG